MNLKELFDFAKAVAQEWAEDEVPRKAAALSYYTLFSLAPLLVIVTAIVGLVFGEEAASGQLAGALRDTLGDDAAEGVQGLVRSARQPTTGLVSSAAAAVTLLFAATGVFGELKGSLNTIWEVKTKPGHGVISFLQEKVLAVGMILAIGFLLLVSLVLSAAVTAITTIFREQLPIPGFVLHAVDFILSLVITAVLFGLIYKALPDVRLAWKDVAVGALATAVLFTIGKIAIGLYLGTSSAASAYGAAGAVVLVLLWVYYSAQIVFLGA